MVLELLRTKVGLPISYSSIAKDVGIAPNTVKKYIQIFEALFIIFKVRPFSKNIARSLLKEPKIYFFDLGLVKGDEGILFENLVGLSLLKNLYYKEDNEGKNYSLHYIKTKEGKEIDFCVVREDKIESIIEVKNKDENLNKALLFFKQTYNYKAIKIVKNLKYEQIRQGIEIRQGINFLRNLEL